MNRVRFQWFAGGLVLALGIAGCDENDLVSLRIRVNEDGSGTLVTSALANPAGPGAVEQGGRGVAWRDRLSLECASGAFDSIGKLAVEDLVFSSSGGGESSHSIEIALPCGPEAKWLRTFVPLSVDERKRLAPLFDPTGNVKSIGAKIKIVIDLPVAPTAHGVLPIVNGVKESVDGQEATLLVPVDTALASTRSMTWQLTWRK
jgi:hypothetical protein